MGLNCYNLARAKLKWFKSNTSEFFNLSDGERGIGKGDSTKHGLEFNIS